MIRKQLLVLALISLCSGVHANVKKDTGRVIEGAVIGAAGMAAVQALCNASKMLIWDGTWDSNQFPGLQYQLIRLSAVIGGVVGLSKTTYGRTLRAQWNVWWSDSSRRLIEITMREHEDDEELIEALESFYTAYPYPLVAAKRDIAYKFLLLQEAAELIEKALEDIEEDSLRAEELNDWLDEIYTVRAHIMYAAHAIETRSSLICNDGRTK